MISKGSRHGPFCIVCGSGALGAVALLTPLADNPMRLYVVSVVMVTTMELVAAFVVVRLFGSFWWDYSKKSLNYRGVICPESSLAWGLPGVIFFRFPNGLVHHPIRYVPESLGKKMAVGLVTFHLVNFAYTVRERMRESEDEEVETIIRRLKLY